MITILYHKIILTNKIKNIFIGKRLFNSKISLSDAYQKNWFDRHSDPKVAMINKLKLKNIDLNVEIIELKQNIMDLNDEMIRILSNNYEIDNKVDKKVDKYMYKCVDKDTDIK